MHAALPSLFPDVFKPHGGTSSLDLAPLTPQLRQQVAEYISSADFDAWTEALDRVGNCAHPIRLVGQSETVDTSTGEVLSTYTSVQEPLRVTHVRCGNRRAAVCPSCSRLYAADTFHLIRAGVTGGKGVPASVAENPLVFTTLTAPSYGPVHGRRDRGHRCHPWAGKKPRCAHGRPTACQAQHAQDDPALGRPLCPDCYDYASQVVWQWWAPDLWRRFTITLRRLVAKTLGVPASALTEVATVQYAKVAEYQLRGVVHFHALVRLDGPRTPDGFAPAPPALGAARLVDLIHQAAASVRLTVPGVDPSDPARCLAFGYQLDARVVRTSRRTDDPDRALAPEQVAGYLAKYATKSATDTGVTDNPHHHRIRTTARSLSVRAKAAILAPDPAEAEPEENRYELLGKWVHMLGFRGHFASKSRRYSVTLGVLRRARRRAQVLIAEHRANGRPLDLADLEADLLADDDTETTLVVGNWSYAGSGWSTDAERVLATAAAAHAREYARETAQMKAEMRASASTADQGQQEMRMAR